MQGLEGIGFFLIVKSLGVDGGANDPPTIQIYLGDGDHKMRHLPVAEKHVADKKAVFDRCLQEKR